MSQSEREVLWGRGFYTTDPGTLHRCVETNLYRVAKEMIAGGLVSVNARDRFDLTPLFYAAENGRLKIAQLLLANGADPNALNHRKELGGVSALTVAIQERHRMVARVLLVHGANPNGADREGWVPLVDAAGNGDIAAVRMLLKHGANRKLKDWLGNTALSTAKSHKYRSIVALLRDRGVK